MTTIPVLKILHEMKADFERIPVVFNCRAGFCSWLLHSIYLNYEDLIIAELLKDKPKNGRISYWYECYVDNLDYANSMKPRIEHLNRTIARLENQLKTEQNGTIQ